MFTINLFSMGKSKKSLSALQQDLQTLKNADMAKLKGGKAIRKNKWNKPLGGYTPE